MSNLTELQPSDLLVHIDNQYDPFLVALSSQASTSEHFDPNQSHGIIEQIIQYIQNDIAALPRESFVSKLVEKCKELHCDLENIRYTLLDLAKRQPKFPFVNATLKKRLCPRKQNGESIENKLGNDCYVLYLATIGEFCEDLKITLSVRSTPQTNRKISNIEENNLIATSFSQNLSVKESLVRIERELNSLKGDYTLETEYLNKTISDLSRENKKLNEKQNERMKNLQIQLSSLRESNSKLNVEVNSLKAFRQEAEAKSKKDKREVEKSLNEIKDLKHNLIICETTKTEVNKLKSDIKMLNTSVSDLSKSLNIESIRINQLNDSRVQGVVSLKAKTNIINDKVKDFDNELNTMKNNVNTYSKAISDLRSRITHTEKELKAMDKTKCSYASALKTNQEHCSTQTKSYETFNSESLSLLIDDTTKGVIQNSATTTATITQVSDSHKHLSTTVNSSCQNPPSVSCLPPHATRTVRTIEQEKYHDNELKSGREIADTNKQLCDSKIRIPIHFPSSMCNPLPADMFSGYQSQQKRKVRRYYVGGIDTRNSTEASMRKYLSDRHVHVTHLRYFAKQNKRTASAQLNIDADCDQLISHPSFWPPGIFMKEWLPWSVFTSLKNEHNY